MVGTIGTGSAKDAQPQLRELLRRVRTGSLEEAKRILVELGAPEPSPEARWSETVGRQFFTVNLPFNENFHYIWFVTMAAELYDQFGAHRLAEQCLQSHNLQVEIGRDLDLLTGLGDKHITIYVTDPEKWRLIRQKLYFWLEIFE